MPPVGNDVIDLAASGNPGKNADDRFRNRVFTDDEQTLISGAARPDTLLWTLWAAKEAAFKAVRRNHPGIHSIPRQYRVILDTDHTSGTETSLAGKVVTPIGNLALRIELTAEWVHALAAGSEQDISRLRQRVEPMEGTEDSTDPSAFVRKFLLLELADILDCAVGNVSIITDDDGSGIPRVLLHGRFLAAEFSLSHDGRFAAFAFDPATLVPAETD